MATQQINYDPALMYGAASSNTVPQTITSTDSQAFAVGRQGATNPVFQVDASTASVISGLKVKGAATGTAVAVTATGSATDELLTIDAKGAGTIKIGTISTGVVTVGSLLHKPLTEVVTATNVIAASESGSVFFLNSATEFVSTLPAPAAGLKFDFIVTAAPSGASYTIVTTSSSNIILGQAYTVDVNSATDPDFEVTGCDTISFVDGKAVVGDRVQVHCDGTNWFAYGFSSVFDAITFTTAS